MVHLTLKLQNDEESTEIDIISRREEAREVEDYYEHLSNRQFIVLPTPLADPSQQAVVKLSLPLTPSSCEVNPCLSEPCRLRKEGSKSKKWRFL